MGGNASTNFSPGPETKTTNSSEDKATKTLSTGIIAGLTGKQSWVPRKDDVLKGHVKLPVPGLAVDHSYHTMWLRINCHCPQCTTTVSNQRSFSPWHYNPDLNSKPSPDFLFGHSSKEPFSSQTFEVTRCWDSPTSEKDEGMLDVEFQDGRDGSQHVGKVPKELLVKMYKETTFAKQISAARTPRPLVEPVEPMNYTDFVSSDESLFRALSQLMFNGVVLIKGAPSHTETIQMCMSKFGPIEDTIYGLDWRVKIHLDQSENAIGVNFKDYHMDLVCFESGPGLQGLHAYQVDSSCEGGDSLLLDIFAIAEEFRQLHPSLFKTLTQIPVTFNSVYSKEEKEAHKCSHKPHIEVNRDDVIVAVNWVPQTDLGLFLAKQEEIDDYYQAYCKFGQMIQDSKLRHRFKLEENDVLIFNNRRMVHGRSALKSGSRYLIGAFVTIDNFLQKYNDMAMDRGLKPNPVRVGNQDRA
ncbi:gamma-butyrobetaine dioxygenase-like [Convolutriloba macropyga]|uniref:gamma-butyrobetaine dioxygenase-like n=1 Tax=Convolutriloba macropyga TaxID=536237 RepID=UPI003F51E801